MICPSGFYAYAATKMCLSCALHCVNLTLTGQKINSGASMEFLFTFDEVMDWTNFNWRDYIYFGSTDTLIDPNNDYDVVYT